MVVCRSMVYVGGTMVTDSCACVVSCGKSVGVLICGACDEHIVRA